MFTDDDNFYTDTNKCFTLINSLDYFLFRSTEDLEAKKTGSYTRVVSLKIGQV